MTKDSAKNQSELIKFVSPYCFHVSYVNNELGYRSVTTCGKKSENWCTYAFFQNNNG